MARHYYDVYRLIERGIASQAIAESGLFEQVAADRKIFFSIGWVDYDSLQPKTLQMLPNEKQAQGWISDYQEMQAEMFNDSPPDFARVIEAVSTFQEGLRQEERGAPD
jgi:hypothetical protein